MIVKFLRFCLVGILKKGNENRRNNKIQTAPPIRGVPKSKLTKAMRKSTKQCMTLNLTGCFKEEGTSVVRKCLTTAHTKCPRKNVVSPPNSSSHRTAMAPRPLGAAVLKN